MIDQDLVDLYRALILENLEHFENVLGEENVEEMIQGYQEENLQVTFGNTVLDFAWSLISVFIISLIVAGEIHTSYFILHTSYFILHKWIYRLSSPY